MSGIKTGQDARFFGISTKFEPFSNKGKDLVIQYQMKHTQNIDCGGGYIKVWFNLFVFFEQHLSRHSKPLFFLGKVRFMLKNKIIRSARNQKIWRNSVTQLSIFFHHRAQHEILEIFVPEASKFVKIHVGQQRYYFMFGPDQCGSTKRIHVILNYKGMRKFWDNENRCQTFGVFFLR